MTMRDFLEFALGQYLARTDSIFLDGLVGGMFLTFLMDTPDNCQDRTFTQWYFVIGVMHFVSGMMNNMKEYAEMAADQDGAISVVEKYMKRFLFFMLHLVRAAELPMVGVLGYYVSKIYIHEGDKWTQDRTQISPQNSTMTTSPPCNVCFCEENYVQLAGLTFFIQVAYGVVLVVLVCVMWFIDSDDDTREMEQQVVWQQQERARRGTWYGNVWEVVLLLGMRSFWGERMADAMLSLAVSLPSKNCKLDVIRWFLYGSVAYTLTGVLGKLQKNVKNLAEMDGIINRAEYIVIQVLSLLKLPLFVFELVCFSGIVYEVLNNFNNVDHEKKDKDSEYFCEASVWKFMNAIVVIYFMVLLCRILVIIGALSKGSRPEGSASVAVEDGPSG